MEELRTQRDIRHRENKYQGSWCQSYLIGNYIKCKWIEISTSKCRIRLAEWLIEHDPTICCIQRIQRVELSEMVNISAFRWKRRCLTVPQQRVYTSHCIHYQSKSKTKTIHQLPVWHSPEMLTDKLLVKKRN